MISSRHNPLVRSFRELARTPHASGARLLLDGVHLVREAMAAGAELETVAIASSRTTLTEEAEVARAVEAYGARVFTVAEAAFAAMSPVRAPSGIVAIARRAPTEADDICRQENGFVLIAVDVQDPGNVGSLMRAGEAGGVSGQGWPPTPR
jgi:TrmH family RNA methyltransferase